MKNSLLIEHHARFHRFRHLIKKLENSAHAAKVVAINKGRDLELLYILNITIYFNSVKNISLLRTRSI